MRIYKYPLGETLSAGIPKGAKTVHVAFQANHLGQRVLTLWVEVDPDEPAVHRRFTVFATGDEIPPGHVHVYTWLEGSFVWHLYEVDQ